MACAVLCSKACETKLERESSRAGIHEPAENGIAGWLPIFIRPLGRKASVCQPQSSAPIRRRVGLAIGDSGRNALGAGIGARTTRHKPDRRARRRPTLRQEFASASLRMAVGRLPDPETQRRAVIPLPESPSSLFTASFSPGESPRRKSCRCDALGQTQIPIRLESVQGRR